MAVVVSSDERAHFSPSLRRSHSAPKFGSKHHSFRSSSSASRIGDVSYDPLQVFAGSLPTSPPSSPQTLSTSSSGLSPMAKPSSGLPLGHGFDLDPVPS